MSDGTPSCCHHYPVYHQNVHALRMANEQYLLSLLAVIKTSLLCANRLTFAYPSLSPAGVLTQLHGPAKHNDHPQLLYKRLTCPVYEQHAMQLGRCMQKRSLTTCLWLRQVCCGACQCQASICRDACSEAILAAGC